jgi:hypothetical protein
MRIAIAGREGLVDLARAQPVDVAHLPSSEGGNRRQL